MTHISPDASRAAPARTQSLTSPPGSFLLTYLAVWASTVAAAALTTTTGASGKTTVRSVLALTLTPVDNPPPSITHVLALAAHNLPIAAWPLLLGVAGIASSQWGKRAADSLLFACALANTIPVGAAIAAYGTRLIAYIPQLPVEWAALATGYASWVTQRRQPLRRRRRLQWLAAIGVLVLAAATIETLAVPHRTATERSGDLPARSWTTRTRTSTSSSPPAPGRTARREQTLTTRHKQ